MSICNPSVLRKFLDDLGIYPKKGLSQNFLIDGNIIRKIIEKANVNPGDAVLEIGPGPGSLTQAMLEAGARVIAVEKDPVLAQALNRLQTPSQQLLVFCEDILSFSLDKEIPKMMKEDKKVKVIANLPYHLTTPIIAQLVEHPDLFSSLTLMVQEEVARRFIALPGTADYSSFTIFLRFHTYPLYAFTVSKNCFYPAPKVNSAIVTLQLHEPPLTGAEADSFFRLTRTAFEHRRKMMRASLKHLYSPKHIEDALQSIGKNPLARPETLSLEDFLELHKLL